MHIAWNTSLSVGVEEIDRQHEVLFERADALISCNRTVCTWWLDHVGGSDRLLGEFLRKGYTTARAQPSVARRSAG